MPQDLPGFYYDAEKNRYFPIKGPIPGSSRSSSHKSVLKPDQAESLCRRMGIKASKLLQARELYGNVITSSKGKCNFQEEYQKMQASLPMIWKYHGTERIADGALEQIYVDIDTPNGLVGTNILLAGGINGSLSLYEVGQQFDNGVKCMPDRVWPLNIENQAGCHKVPGHLWRPAQTSIQMRSNISCVRMYGKHSTRTVDDASSMQHVLITTLGSETSGGSINILNLSEPLDYNPSTPLMGRRIYEVTSLNSTVWTADCNSDGSRAVVGTNLGAALVNLETGTPSWVCRCKSDVLSLQLDHSGNIALCGLRNGAIVTVDTRQKPEEFSARLTRHRIPYPSRGTSEPSSKTARNFTKQWFELKGNINHSYNIYMPSSISCLASLQLYDQYFLASSMDGSIKLYDHRLIQRGAVQSYEGHVNSHTRVQLGVDPLEKFFMSGAYRSFFLPAFRDLSLCIYVFALGGEDCNLRFWSIKSGKLLFEHKFMNSVPSIVCWPRIEGLPEVEDKRQTYRNNQYEENHSSVAWLGSQEGLFYMRWS
ncbi:hypothetical protein F0562_029605 [Nyssa sinensis]|uniref:Uncharacterized protein n=1 Tax=Nyssa sinensis TaxID=561372 RepID=A0A5J5B3I8_9ASTE|nr:hypothetical protein F0562_029605 [Nyssa sinensis]